MKRILAIQLVIGLLAAVAAPVPPASGQASGLPEAISVAPAIGAGEQAQIEAFVKEQAPKLLDADTHVREAARDALLKPLHPAQGEPSSSFRLYYSKALGPSLAPLVANQNVGVVFGALRLGGALGSEAGFTALKAGIEDSRPAVRRMAAAGMGELLAGVSAGKSVVPSDKVDAAIDLLEAALAKEPDILVIDGLTLALSEASKDSPLRVKTLTAMCQGLAKQIADHRAKKARASEQELGVFVRAVNITKNELIQQMTNTSAGAALPTAAGVLAGQAMSYCLQQLTLAKAAGKAVPLDQTLLDELATVAESTALLAVQSRTKKILDEKVRQAFERAMQGGQIDQVRTTVMQWVGPDGILTKAPYNVKSDEFTNGL